MSTVIFTSFCGVFLGDVQGGEEQASANLAVSVTGGGDEEEENDEPPKVVVTEVKEEDAFYSKK